MEINWNIFKVKFDGKEEKAFEDLAYKLFCYEHQNEIGIFRYKNQTGVETEPINVGDEIVGFQAKYFDHKIDKKKINDSIAKAKKKNSNISKVLLYINIEFAESPKEGEKSPKNKLDIEQKAKDIGVTINWRVPSHIELQLSRPENKHIWSEFFCLRENIPTNEVKEVINNQLDKVEERIFKRLDFSTSLDYLNHLLIALDKHIVSTEQKNLLKSRISFLQGWCLLMLAEFENREKFINAYHLSPENLKYKAYASISHYKMRSEDKAIKLAKEIIKCDIHNSLAYVVVKCIEKTTEVPKEVLQNKTFIYHYSILNFHQDEKVDISSPLLDQYLRQTDSLPEIKCIDDFFFQWRVLTYTFEFLTNSKESKQEYYELAGNKDVKKLIKGLLRMVNYIHTTPDLFRVPHFSYINWLYCFSKYIYNPTKDNSRQLYNTFILIENKTEQHQYEDTLVALYYNYQNELIRDLYIKQGTPYNNYLVIIAGALYSLGQNDDGHELLIKYAKSLKKIGVYETHNLTIAFELEAKNNYSTTDLYELVKEKEFESNDLSILLNAYASFLGGNSIAEYEQDIMDVYKNNDRLEEPLKILLSIVLIHLKLFKESNSVVTRINDFASKEFSLRIYIDNQISLQKSNKTLLSYLEKYRGFRVDIRFLQYEINQYFILNDFESVKKLSSIGGKYFPQNSYFKYNKIIGCYYFEDKEGLMSELTDSLVREYTFGWQQAFFLARICSENEKRELANEIAYKCTKENYESNHIKDQYFQFYLFNTKQLLNHEIVEVNVYVYFEINGEKIVTLFDREKLEDPFFKNFYGKGKGTFSFIRSLGDEPDFVKIIEIVDKYRALFLQINIEIERSKYSGSNIKLLKFDEISVESIGKALIKTFGIEAGIHKRKAEERLSDYKKGKCGFTELTLLHSVKSIFDIYYFLRNTEKHYITPHLAHFKNIKTNRESLYVLDIPVVILLAELSKQHNIQFENKFTISNNVKEYFKLILKEEKDERKTNFSINIDESSFNPVSIHEDQRRLKIQMLEDILGWIEECCIIGIAKNKLEILEHLNNPDFDANQYLYWEYVFETVLLANQDNHFLVTDDAFFYRMFAQKSVCSVSTEFFLKNELTINEYSNLVLQLIESNYIGLTLNTDTLISAFEKAPILESPNNLFLKALKCLDYYYNPNRENFDTALAFVKDIYSRNMPLHLKKHISQLTFQNVFRKYKLEPKDRKSISQKIKNEMHLLGTADIQVLDDVSTVLDIRNLTNDI